MFNSLSDFITLFVKKKKKTNKQLEYEKEMKIKKNEFSSLFIIFHHNNELYWNISNETNLLFIFYTLVFIY